MTAVCSAQIGEGEARLNLWRQASGESNATATVDGDRVVAINGSTALADEAMSIAGSDVAAYMLALVAAQDAPAIATAAEITSLESDLTNAVKVAFGVMPPYSAGVQANYKTTLRNQMRKARADVEAATTLAELRAAQKTLNQRQEIINIVRELRAIKSDWTLSEIGQ